MLEPAIAALLPPPVLGHDLLMPPRKTKDAERVRFIAPPGSSKLYAEVAALEGLDKDAWIRSTLHDEATRVLEAHGEDTSRIPPRHLKRPPRLQPRMLAPPPDDDGNTA